MLGLPTEHFIAFFATGLINNNTEERMLDSKLSQ